MKELGQGFYSKVIFLLVAVDVMMVASSRKKWHCRTVEDCYIVAIVAIEVMMAVLNC